MFCFTDVSDGFGSYDTPDNRVVLVNGGGVGGKISFFRSLL